MLLKVKYLPEEDQPHPSILFHFACMDDKGLRVNRVQEFNTETMVGILANGEAVNVHDFGWFPPDPQQHQELLKHLPRLYHDRVQLIDPSKPDGEACNA